MIIIYKEFKEGKAEFTKKEFEELLEKARQDGYNEGYLKGYTDGKYTPPIINPNSPISPTYPTVYGSDGTLSNIKLA